MANEVKKQKLCCDDTTNSSKTLNETCDWNHLDNTAIEFHDLTKIVKVTYAEIDAAKSIIGGILKHIGAYEFVGIGCDVSPLCIPSLIIGINSAGHAFINLPVDLRMCTDLLAQLDMKYVFIQHVTLNAKVVCHFQLHEEHIYLVMLDDRTQRNIQKSTWNNYAYAIATSGSTGRPKVIKVTHACIIPNIQDMKQILNISQADKIIQLTSYTFDPSIIEIFLSFSCSSTLLTVSRNLKNDPCRLLQIISHNRVTVLQTTPSLFFQRWSLNQIAEKVLGKASHLRVLLLGGEPFPEKQMISTVKHKDNQTKVFNVYGITEVSCWSNIHEITSCTADSSYLGSALSDTILQVRNKNKVVHVGEGSLFVGSNTRICAVGDEMIEELSRPVFRDTGDIVTINAKGQIFYKGRRNRIIKRYGNKVNLQYLDQNVLQLSYIRNAHSFWNERNHKLHLCLLTAEKSADVTNVTSKVAEQINKLPTFYKPDKIHVLEHLELTENGKICTRFVERVCLESETVNDSLKCVLPHQCQSIEDIFRDIWKAHLKCTNGGFVELGGTSVTALQISATASEILRSEFPELIGALLRNCNIEECLVHIRKNVVPDRQETVSRNVATDVLADHKETTCRADKVVDRKQERISNAVVNKEDVCVLQKCKGRVNAYLDQLHEHKTKLISISNIKILNSYDLEKCVDASPTIFECSNGKSFVTVGSHSGIICTAELGEEKHSSVYKVKLPDRVEASILVVNDFEGIVGCYDGCVYFINLRTGNIIWKFQTRDVVKCTAITCGSCKNVFVGSYDHYIYCLRLEDGSEVWKTKPSNGSICAAGCVHSPSESVLFGTLDGTCVALKQATGKIIWSQKLTDPIFVSPVILNNGHAVFCSVAGTLCCFDIIADEKMWSYIIYGNIFSYPLVKYNPITATENIVVASKNKKLYCLEINGRKDSPTVKCVLNYESPIFSTPWCDDDLIFVACTNGRLSVHRFSNGEMLAAYALPNNVFSSPVVHHGNVTVGCRDNNLYILKVT